MANEIQKEKITVWSTKAVNEYMEDVDNGVERKDSPFFYGDHQLRKPHLLFEYTQDEIEEMVRCKQDVNYFANHYAYTMNPSTGALNLITLRDYQEDLLNTINDNRYTVIVAARQSGKCVSPNTVVETENGKRKIGEMFVEKKSFLSFFHRILLKIYDRI
jgi:hypothetical protein